MFMYKVHESITTFFDSQMTTIKVIRITHLYAIWNKNVSQCVAYYIHNWLYCATILYQ